MNRFIGVGFLLVGVILMLFGLDAKDSLSSRLSRLFDGAPSDKAIWLLILGVLAAVVGAGAMLKPGRSPGS